MRSSVDLQSTSSRPIGIHQTVDVTEHVSSVTFAPKEKLKCAMSGCNERFENMKALMEHLNASHNQTLTPDAYI